MYKTVASKDGGHNVSMTPQEIVARLADEAKAAKKSKARKTASDKKIAAKKAALLDLQKKTGMSKADLSLLLNDQE